jgi:hypothetical protein
MAHASKTHFGEGSQGKGDGSGAMTHLDPSLVGENDILSNRDKKSHGQARGLDGNAVKTAQYQDHSANRLIPPEELDGSGSRD